MFTGSVCAHAREWFKANARAFAGKKVLCGCSGNFTIETVLSQAPDPPAEIISNDVSLYSSALGAYYTSSNPLQLTIQGSDYEFLASFTKSAHATAATVVVLLELAPFAKRQTAYHDRMADAFLSKFRSHHAKAAARLKTRKAALHISEYKAEDVKVFLRSRSKGDVFLSFMPTYAGGYERLYKFLDNVLVWADRPKYEIMGADGKDALLSQMKHQGQYVHVDDKRRENLGVVGVIHGGHNLPVYIHSDLADVGSDVYVRSKQIGKRPNIDILGADETIESDAAAFVALSNHEFSWLRDQYLNAKIVPADPTWRFGLCLDGKLVGIIGWARGKDGVSYYMMCDLPTNSNRYQRLSKLIVMAANTKEMLKVLRQQTGKFWDSFQTTAFTERAVSMKYRGVLNLRKRNTKENMLIYEGHFRKTLKKAVKKWRKLEKLASSKQS